VKDIEMQLESREAEISDFITRNNQEREKLISRLNEIDQSSHEAERDLERCRRARIALRGKDEPKEAATAMVDELMPPRAGYYPGGN